MLEDEESNQRQQLMRHMFLRSMVPGFTRADLLQSFFRERNDSSMLYRMAFDLIDKENPIGNDRRRFRRESKRAREYMMWRKCFSNSDSLMINSTRCWRVYAFQMKSNSKRIHLMVRKHCCYSYVEWDP